MTARPQHEKLTANELRREAAQDFLDFLLHEKGWSLAAYHKHDEGCMAMVNVVGLGLERERVCGMNETRLRPQNPDSAELIAEFLGIDLKELEREKRSIMDEIHDKRGG